MFEEIGSSSDHHESVDLDALGDMVSSVVEGGLVLQRALREHNAASQQIMPLRSCIKLLFAPRAWRATLHRSRARLPEAGGGWQPHALDA